LEAENKMMLLSPITHEDQPYDDLAVEFAYPSQWREAPNNSMQITSTQNIAINYDSEFACHFAKLSAIERNPYLCPDGAAAPERIALLWADRVLRQLEDVMLRPSRVVASGEGGVAICFVQGDSYADIECLNTGAILGVTSNKRDRPDAWEIDPGTGGIARAIERVRKFLLSSSPAKNDAKRPRRRSWLQAFAPTLPSVR
jgi:hypothetical protein